MTTTDAIRDLVAQIRSQGKDIVWLADQVLLVAQHGGRIALSDTTLGEDNSDFRRLFRPLLARMAKVAADESGAAFDPYSGHYTLTRSGRGGPVRVEIEIQNTTAVRRLQIDVTPISTPDRSSPSDATSVSTSPPQTTA